MAGTVTTTEEAGGRIQKVSFDWLASTAGTATAQTARAYSGAVLRAVFVPDGSSTQPTNLYDVAVNDEDGYDILAGQGANLSNSAAVTVVTSMGAVANDKITLDVSNAGSEKGGVVHLYIR